MLVLGVALREGIGLLGLPGQNTTDWGAETTEIYVFTVPEAGNPRLRGAGSVGFC